MDPRTNENTQTTPAPLADAADRFVKYGIAGLAAQGDLSQGDAGRELLKAVARWFGIDFERAVEALGEED